MLPTRPESIWHAKVGKSGGVTAYTFDQLMKAIHESGEVNSHTPLSVPANPNVFKPAGEWPAFQKKFGTTPWKVRINGAEYIARGNVELREWAGSKRIAPDTEIFDDYQEEWVKAGSLTELKGAFNAGCLGSFLLGLR
ncbi:MAG TPA: hypothetical protein VNN25_10185 [Thermoanaerobaculia bacterium]|nr:hypothetical protein [Thermoanaerobaculia bacterium]